MSKQTPSIHIWPGMQSSSEKHSIMSTSQSGSISGQPLGTQPFTHGFPAFGTYTITAEIEDKDSGITELTKVVNIVPAFLGVPLRIYAIATFVGIIPGAFVFASVGAGLGSIFDSMEEFSPSAAVTPEVITALVGLALLSLLPVAYKKIKARRTPA